MRNTQEQRMDLWKRCAAYFRGVADAPLEVPKSTLKVLHDIYKSGDLWKGEGSNGTTAERMLAFTTTERVESILNGVLQQVKEHSA